jgi:hypothetical protein
MDGQSPKLFPKFRLGQPGFFAFVHNLDGAASPSFNHPRDLSITLTSFSISVSASLSNLEKANHFLPKSFKDAPK